MAGLSSRGAGGTDRASKGGTASRSGSAPDDMATPHASRKPGRSAAVSVKPASRRCLADVGSAAARVRRRSLRRSSSVSPPQIPWFCPVLSAKRRHACRTGHRAQTALAAAIWSSAGPAEPTGKNSSGSSPRQAARARQPSWSHAEAGCPVGRAAEALRLFPPTHSVYLGESVFTSFWFPLGRSSGSGGPPPGGQGARVGAKRLRSHFPPGSACRAPDQNGLCPRDGCDWLGRDWRCVSSATAGRE
jgi:hypothetical protein